MLQRLKVYLSAAAQACAGEHWKHGALLFFLPDKPRSHISRECDEKPRPVVMSRAATMRLSDVTGNLSP